MSGTIESKDRPPREGGRNGRPRGRDEGGKPQNKGADNATGRGKGEPEALTTKRVDPQDPTSLY
jgi:hypothetical protein